jgi:hypothetical protein
MVRPVSFWQLGGQSSPKSAAILLDYQRHGSSNKSIKDGWNFAGTFLMKCDDEMSLKLQQDEKINS